MSTEPVRFYIVVRPCAENFKGLDHYLAIEGDAILPRGAMPVHYWTPELPKARRLTLAEATAIAEKFIKKEYGCDLPVVRELDIVPAVFTLGRVYPVLRGQRSAVKGC